MFEATDGTIRLDVPLEAESVWLSLNQIAELFGRDKSVISRHLRNVFTSGELERASVVAENATTATDGKSYQVEYFNLDAILSVGYRVNSKRGTQFRIWATRTLREHLVRGYNIHSQRFERNARELEATLALVRKTAGSEALSTDEGRRRRRAAEGVRHARRSPDSSVIVSHAAKPPISSGVNASRAWRSLLGNLDQSVFGKPAYATVESKAAHLLYFVIKNRPFADGNKRIGSFLFVDLLHRNGRLDRDGRPALNDVGLAALALLVAASTPQDKDVMIRLVMNMRAAPDA